MAEELHVLVVDNERAQRTLVKMTLEGEGMTVSEAATFPEGVNEVQYGKERPDVVVEDRDVTDAPPEGGIIGMGKLLESGQYPIGLVGATANTAQIPSIMAALSSMNLVRHAEVIAKPYDLQDLIDAVLRVSGVQQP